MNRLAYKQVSPKTYEALLALEAQVRRSSLERGLIDLVYLRVSQVNGCAFCVDMHDKDLRAAGEKPERLALLVVWREAPCFTPRERVALAWAEAVTRLGGEGPGDALYEQARAELGEAALVDLTLAVSSINTWNRMNIAFGMVPGSYKAAAR